MQFYNSSIPSFKNGEKKLNKTFVVSTQKRLKSLLQSINFEFWLELVNSNQGEFKP